MKHARATKPPLKPSAHGRSVPEVTDAFLISITQRLLKALPLVKVVLFGSHAYGNPRKDSDIDLLVILDSTDSKQQRYVNVYQAAEAGAMPMDLLVRTPAEIEARLASGDFFIQDILEKGKVLYDRDAAR